MAEKEVRKTAVKKAPRRTTTKVVSSRTAVRKIAASAVSSSARKAPARTVRTATPRKNPSAMAIIFLVCMLAIIGGSVVLGFSDSGSIDVADVIASRKQNATPEEQERFNTVPVQQGQGDAVNGGLVGTGKPQMEVPPPQLDLATTSSSTTQTATTTDALSSEEETTPEQQQEQTEELPAEASQEPVAL